MQFDQVYKIVAESNNIDDLKTKQNTVHIDAKTIKNGNRLTTVAAQLAAEGENIKVE